MVVLGKINETRLKSSRLITFSPDNPFPHSTRSHGQADFQLRRFFLHSEYQKQSKSFSAINYEDKKAFRGAPFSSRNRTIKKTFTARRAVYEKCLTTRGLALDKLLIVFLTLDSTRSIKSRAGRGLPSAGAFAASSERLLTRH